MGLLAAVEQWVARDHKAEWKEWERRLGIITEAVKDIDSVTTSIREPGRSNVAPVLEINWEAETVGMSGIDAADQLSAGEPRIELHNNENGISIMPYMMEEGEDKIVAARIREVLNA